MKTSRRCLLLLVFTVLLIPSFAWAQDEYYVTIGVFAVQDNAVRYTAKANKAGFSAQYAINTERNYYYVYLLQTPEKRKAVSFMVKVRAESDYKDAWVFIGHLGVDRPVEEKPAEPVVTPAVTPVIAPVVAETKTEPTPTDAAVKKDSVIEVKPTPVPYRDFLAQVTGDGKGVRFTTDMFGELTIVGGAGGPSAAAGSALKDLVNLARAVDGDQGLIP